MSKVIWSLLILVGMIWGQQFQELQLTASDGEGQDHFGTSVAIEGNTIIIGAEQGDPLAGGAGAAYIYQWNGTQWQETQKITAQDGEEDDLFGTSVAIEGNTIIIGAKGNGKLGTGAVYIFQWNGTQWQETQKITAQDGEIGDWFGHSVAINQETIIIGAYLKNGLVTNAGAAYIYQWNGTQWQETQKITAQDGYWFGHSVAINQETIIIGSPGDYDLGIDAGAAYIYQWNGTQWQETQKITAQDGEAGSWFGYSVAINQETIIIGSHRDSEVGAWAGAAYIYQWNGTQWQETQKITAQDGFKSDLFGFSVAINQETIIIGALFHDQPVVNAGAAYIYQWNGTQWQETTKLTPSDAQNGGGFGTSVSLDQENFLIGSPNFDLPTVDVGAAYVYTPSQNPIEDVTFRTIYRNTSYILDTDPIQICADGSESTQIFIYAPGFANQIEVRVAEGDDQVEFGSFTHDVNNNDNVVATYTHPTVVPFTEGLYRSITFEFVDIGSDIVLQTQEVELYRAAIAFAHGTWSSPDAFKYYIPFFEAYWPKDLMFTVDYSSTNDRGFQVNRDIVGLQIIDSVNVIRCMDYSAARVNLVTHSLGGPISRVFLQSVLYDGDFVRFIPLNGTHSGTQLANVAISTQSFFPTIAILAEIAGRSVTNGAVHDQAVNSDGIDFILNGDDLNLNVVPTHSLASTFQLTPRHSPATFNVIGWAVYAEMLKLSLGDGYNLFMHELFNEEHDTVVPLSSQQGGILNTLFPGLTHSEILSDEDYMFEIQALLNTDPADVAVFTQTGFDPPDLDFILPTNYLPENSNLDWVSIDSPSQGDDFLAGETIVVVISASEEVDTVAIVAGNQNTDASFNKSHITGTTQFELTLPVDSYGEFGIAAAGFSSNGIEGIDSVFINVTTKATLDSIILPDTISAYSDGGFGAVTVRGAFSDGQIRSLGTNEDLLLSTGNSSIATVELPGIITGHQVGITNLTAQLEGVSAEAAVKVVQGDVFVGADTEEDSPGEFTLYQNYPNPFNPSTTITYNLPKSTSMTLTIYNILGQRVRTLIDDKQVAGVHTVLWDGRNESGEVASGVYFYRLQTQNHIETRKMVLMR